MFAHVQLLCNWCEQWPRNKDDLASFVRGEVGNRLLHENGPASDLIFEPQYVTVGRLHFK
jgi:hypothetical protein